MTAEAALAQLALVIAQMANMIDRLERENATLRQTASNGEEDKGDAR